MRHVLPLLLLLLTTVLQAQMWNGRDTLYGNEWIDYDQDYYKIFIAEDGIYRISYAQLQQAGIDVTGTAAGRYQLFLLGEEVALYTPATAGAALQPGDYLEFYGRKNRAELDRYLFKDPDGELLNPEYSMFTDTAAYFLTVGVEGTQGKRYQEVANELEGAPAAEEYIWFREQEVYFGTITYLKRGYRLGGVTITYSHFDLAEGYGTRDNNGLLSNNVRPQELSLTLKNLYPAGPEAVLRTRFACGAGDHDQRIEVNGRAYYQEQFTGFSVKDTTLQIPAGNLLEGNNSIVFSGQEAIRDNQSVALLELTYPRRPDLGQDSILAFQLFGDGNRKYAEFTNYDAEAGPAVLYDPVNNRRLVPDRQGTTLQAAFPAFTGRQNWLLLGEREVRRVDGLQPLQLEAYSDTGADYIIITHALLNNEANGPNQVAAYASYRSSEAGGGFRPLIVDVAQLYDQFGYGIDQHSQALRNFGHYINKNWRTPRYVLLLGRGMEYPYARTPDAGHRQDNLVPTFGRPGSDNLLFSTNDSSVPLFSVGRIAARNAADIRSYLEKVKRHEAGLADEQTVEAQAWRKRVLHLVGGDAGEQAVFSSYLDQMGAVLDTNEYGAKLETVFRFSSVPGEPSNVEAVTSAMNEGVGIKTFLGHGSVVKTDFGFDDPAIFDNHPRFPLIFSLGCLSGNMYVNQFSISEAFVLEEEGGSIGYIASSGFGLPSSLYALTRKFYELVGGELYGQGMGDIVRAVRAHFDDNSSLVVKTYVEQMSYHGDPAVAINGLRGPDFTTDYRSVQIGDGSISVLDDSLGLSFELLNIGAVRQEAVDLAYVLETPAGEEFTFLDTVNIRSAFNQVEVRLPLPAKAQGLNRLYISIDPNNAISELPTDKAENNNELVSPTGERGIAFLIAANEAVPADPPDFGITNVSTVTLTAVTSNPFDRERTYRMELDTSARFVSPLATETVQADGGIITWQPAVSWTDGRVYYWRISPDSTELADNSFLWNRSSFLYSNTIPSGWNQSHLYQFLDNDPEGLRLDEPTRTWRFDTIAASVIGQSDILSITNGDRSAVLFNTREVLEVRRNPSIGLAVFDPLTGRRVVGSTYRLDQQQARKNLMDYLRDEIPEDHYVVMVFSRLGGQDYHLEEWVTDSIEFGYNLYGVLEDLGARQIRELPISGSAPYVYAYQSGRGALAEAIGLPGEENVEAAFNFSYPNTNGAMTAPLIGPAGAWNRLLWAPKNEMEAADVSSIKILGRSAPDAEPVELPITPSGGVADLSVLDARQYPYLQLQLYNQDSTSRTPTGLDYWQVLAEGTARIALDLTAFHADTLDRGETLRLSYSIYNLGAVAAGPLTIQYTLIGPQNEQEVITRQVAGIPAMDTISLVFSWPTDQLPPGSNRLLVEVSRNEGAAPLEFLNAVGEQAFFIRIDRYNPLLDVTFDGVHIMDGDLVSAQPFIVVSLEDENRYLTLQDTGLFDLRLTYPSGRVERVSLAADNVFFKPARPGDDKNRATIEFQPILSEDGAYQLEVVARDVSGNESGAFDYRITFEVIARASMSQVLPYPNPFSTATRFSYTLTGSQPPEYFLIRILTLSGRVVREITKEEFGPMRVGTHLSEFVWDGTDDFGDRLANGVYLYQVVVKDDQQEDYERYERSEIDRFFRKGFGKIVILR